MPSEAYLKILKEVPKNIQDEVIESLSIANEIHLALESNGLRPVDLAKLLGKSESEISKWLTGTHNFTYRTVNRIEEVLGTKLLVTNSYKIAEYEKQLETSNKLIQRLQNKVNKLRRELHEIEFNESLSFTFSSSIMKGDSMDNRYLADFIPYGSQDKIKIKAETKSTLSYKVLNC